MIIPECAILDFETLPIQKRPEYPPKPVSMSLQMPHWDKPKFFAWGHVNGGNNCRRDDAGSILRAVWSSGLPILCHSGKFDYDVGTTEFKLPELPWHRIHDTQFLLFLCNPYSRNLGLKESAFTRLKIKPEERDAVKEWILQNKDQLQRDFPEIVAVHGGIRPGTAGAFIAYAPGEVVSPYANGDVYRTGKLFVSCYKEVVQRGMLEAYDRERRLMPILLRNEREGIRCDLPRLKKMNVQMEDSTTLIDTYIKGRLRATDINLDSSQQLVEALHRVKLGKNFLLTEKGQESTSIESLEIAVKDLHLRHALQYRSRLTNQHRNFVKGWVAQGLKTGGTLHTAWNQTKNGDAALSGARTGRLSTDKPLNLLAVTKKLGRKAKGAAQDAVLPSFVKGLVELPYLRSFLLPDLGCIWVRRDFSQQEYRIAAHAEGGELCRAYNEDPDTDVHEYVDLKIQELMHLDLGRDTVKTLNFGMLFGMGIPSLMLKTGKSMEECKALRRAHKVALPGISALDEELKRMGKAGDYILTWGGRQYYAEKLEGKDWDFSYRLLNYYTQGGGADITKEVVIRYDGTQGRTARLLGPVHDELNTSAKRGTEKEQTQLLREVMASVELDVPMLSDCEMGPSWGEVTKYVDR